MTKKNIDHPIRLRTNIDSSPDAMALPLALCLRKARSTLKRLHDQSKAEQSFEDAWYVAEEWISTNKRSAVDLEDVYATTTDKLHAWVPRLLAIAYLQEAELASKTDLEKSWNALMAVYFFIGINTGSAYEFARKGIEGKQKRSQNFVEMCIQVMEKIHPDNLWSSLTEAYGDLAEKLLRLDGKSPGTTYRSHEHYELRKTKLVRKFQRLSSEKKGGSESFRAKIIEYCKEAPKRGRKRSLTAKASSRSAPDRSKSSGVASKP